MKLKYLEAVSTLVGTIIGAGILGLPYAIEKVGAIPGVVLLIVLGLATLLINLMFAEVILRTKSRHQLAGYALKYLGHEAYWIKLFAVLFGGVGALTIYIIGEGEVLSSLLGHDKFYLSLIFFAFVSLILLGGLKTVKIADLLLVFIFLSIIGTIAVLSGTKIDIANYARFDWPNIFAPYGAILFAMSGPGAIVTLREVLRGEEKKIKSAVIAGTLIPLAIYIVFVLVVIGVTGENTTEVATIGLGNNLSPFIFVFGNLFALFAMTAGFLNNGLILIELLRYDMRLTKYPAWLIVCGLPLLLFLVGSRSFFGTIGIVGSITFGITATALILLFWKARNKGERTPEFSLPKFRIFGYVLIAVFIFGFIQALLLN